MIELFNVNFAAIGFTLIAITLIILTISFFKIPMILGIIFYVELRFPHLILRKVIKTFPYVWVTHNNNKPGKTNIEVSLLLKPSENLKFLVNQFNNNASPEESTDPENIVQSKYYDIDELQTMKIPNKDKSLALFHINACFLNKNFNELVHLFSCTNKNFDLIAASETRITYFSNK